MLILEALMFLVDVEISLLQDWLLIKSLYFLNYFLDSCATQL